MAFVDFRVFVFSIIGFFFGLVLIVKGLKKYFFLEKLKDTPLSKVDSAAVGLVEICGKAECHQPMKSPLSQRDCSYWRVGADYYQHTKNGGYWKQFFSTDSHAQFYLQDDTGKMLVDPVGAQIDIPENSSVTGHQDPKSFFGLVSNPVLPKEALDFINSLSPEQKKNFDWRKGEDIRMRECYIADNDPLFVLGSAEPLDMALGSKKSDTLVLRKGDIDKTMYISDTSQKAVLKKFSAAMYLSVFGGLGLSIISLIIILLFFNVV